MGERERERRRRERAKTRVGERKRRRKGREKESIYVRITCIVGIIRACGGSRVRGEWVRVFCLIFLMDKGIVEERERERERERESGEDVKGFVRG